MKSVSCVGCGVVLHLELLKTNPVIRHWTPVDRSRTDDEGPYVAMLCPFCRHEQREADSTSRVDA